MRRGRLWLCGTAVVVLSLAAAALHAQQQNSAATAPAVQAGPAAAPAPTGPAAQHKAVLDRYCVTCHNDRAKTGGVSLQNIDVTDLPAHGETWEKVIRRVEAGMMPPQGQARPDEAARTALVAWIKTTIDAAATEHPNPGRALLRRLNRAEYANAIRDLLALDVDVASLLPPDDSSYGFDNNADVLGSSPALLERYLNAADEISTLAIGSLQDTVAASKTYVAPSDTTQNEHVEGLPLGTRGGMLIRHTFPVDGEYLLKVRLWRNNSSSIRGLSLPHDLEIAIDGVRVFVDTVGTEADYKALLTNPGDAEALVDPRTQTRVTVTAGPHDVSVAFVFKSDAPNVTLLRPLLASHDPISVDGLPRVDWVLIGGPFDPTGPGDTPSRQRVFICQPAGGKASEDACADRIVRTLARRAYRRAVTADDIRPLIEFYREGRAKGSFDAGIAMAVKRLLTDPSFLFRPELDPAAAAPGSIARVSDVELATRLSFFLWSSIPDDELLDLATRGELRAPGALAGQVKRMLADPRAEAFVSNFAGQWLFLRNLQQSRPDTQEFPDFDDSLRQSFRQETEMLFDYIMRQDRSVLELLTADYTFLNERLARHYKVPGVYGSRFRRVPVTDEARKGILGHGSILTVTSYPNRTSPVRRGKWILEQLLGTPPPPPPPNVPPLATAAPGTRPKTMKAQMEAHRANPTCANCHRLMDPLGFAMENYNGVGAWRVKDGPSTIDATSTLADGTSVDGVVSLRAALMRRPDLFVSTATEKMMTYALGRGVLYNDMPAIRRIVTNAAAVDYRFSAIVQGIVDSVPFQMRMKPYPDGQTPSLRATR